MIALYSAATVLGTIFWIIASGASDANQANALAAFTLDPGAFAQTVKYGFGFIGFAVVRRGALGLPRYAAGRSEPRRVAINNR